MARGTLLTGTTASVAAGATLTYSLTLPAGVQQVTVGKWKVEPSSAGGTGTYEIYSKTAGGGTLLVKSNLWVGDLIQPVRDPQGTPTDAGEFPVLIYTDEDGTNLIHFRITNNDTVAKTYDVTIYWWPIHPVGLNGQTAVLKQLTELTTIAAAATTSTTIQIPARTKVLAVTVRNTVAIPTSSDYDVGITGSVNRFADAVAVAVNTTDPGSDDGPGTNYTSATAILLTMNGGNPANTDGRVRVTIIYWEITPPTS